MALRRSPGVPGPSGVTRLSVRPVSVGRLTTNVAGVIRSSNSSTLRRVERRVRAAGRGRLRRVPVRGALRFLSQLLNENDIVNLQSEGNDGRCLAAPVW